MNPNVQLRERCGPLRYTLDLAEVMLDSLRKSLGYLPAM
jgi:hypothetical protein